jgi:protocatechuate 3,4-dioxygenase beta subunit
MKQLSGFTALLLLALAAPLARAEPAPGSISIRGRITPPVPSDTRVELLPVSASVQEALRQLSGDPEPPLATVRPAADGTFTLTVPEPGFYRVAVRAEGFLDLEAPLPQLLAETDLPPVRLRPAATLEVAVLGVDGKPAAGIAVLGLPSGGGNDAWTASIRRAVSGDDGLLRLPRSEGETLTLVVIDPRFFGQIADSGEERTTLRLKQRPLVEVRVRDANGRPLSGAVLWGGPFLLAATGPDGQLRVSSDLQPGLSLQVETADGREAPLSFSPGESSRTVTPVPQEVRTGRVLDAATRKPLPGALVWQQSPRQARISWTRTEADGSFRLPAEPGVPLVAIAPGYLAFNTPERPSEGPLSVLLEPAVSLAGRVEDGAGRPVADAVIEALPANFQRMDWERGRTRADGTFLLSRLGAGQAYRLEVKAEGFLPARLDATPGAAGEKRPPLRIVLDRGAAVTGRLIDSAGQPVTGAALSLMALPEGMTETWSTDHPLSAMSDAAGRFRLGPAEPGRFQLDLIHPDFALATRPTIAVAGSRDVDAGDLRLAPAVAIEGRVTDGRGAPLPGTRVSISSLTTERRREPAVSDADGRFRLGGLAPGGRFDLTVFHPGHLPHEAPGVEAPLPEPLRITLRPARSLAGRVVDDAGKPIPGVRISLVETRELRMAGGAQGGSSSRSAGETDAEGRFLATHLTPGTVHLSFVASGFRGKVLRGLSIPEEEDPAPVEVVLETGAVLSGRVVDSRGRPAAGLRVLVHPLEPNEGMALSGAEADTEADGGFRIAGLAPGQLRVEVQDWQTQQGRLLAEKTIALGSGGGNRLDLTLPDRHRLSGRVVNEQGEPVRGARLTLTADRGQAASADSAPDGSFRFTDVPEGTWRLTVRARGHAPAAEEVRLAGGDLDGLALRLSRGGTITGRLLGLTGSERGQVRVVAWPEAGGAGTVLSSAVGPVDDEGGYRVPDVGPGKWTVEASLPSGRTGRGVVQLSAPGEDAALDLEIPRGLTLSGRVLLDGQPLSGAAVTAATVHDGGQAGSWQGTTRHDGTFELQGVEPGRVTLAVLAQGIGQARALDLASDQEVTIEIITGLVNGHVLSADGQPVEGALVSLRGENPELAVSFQGVQTRSDERGAFELPRVAAGSYRVTVSRPGSAPVEQRIVVTPAGTTRVEAVLK